MGKYWKHPKEVSSYVSFELEGERNPEIKSTTSYHETPARPKDCPGYACFANITYYPISEEVKSILYKQPIEHFAYGEDEIRRWIADINELGFPCTLLEIDKLVKIRLNLSDFETKEQLISTLYLIRVLHEEGSNVIPGKYFAAMDANPEADKFIELQKAHKSARDSWGGHTGITAGSTPNLSKAEVFANFKRLGKPVYFDGKWNVAVQSSWGQKAPKGYAI